MREKWVEIKVVVFFLSHLEKLKPYLIFLTLKIKAAFVSRMKSYCKI